MYAIRSYYDYNSSPDPIIVPSIFDESEPINSIPLPPDGQRWVLNEQFSDEFNGSQLDESKWVTPHPTWIVITSYSIHYTKLYDLNTGLCRVWQCISYA